MKCLITLFLLFICYFSSATVYTVDNSGNSNAQFNDLQVAIDQAVDGDTLYVVGTFKAYDASNTSRITLDKRLVLIGEGPFKTADGAINEGEFTLIDMLFLQDGADGSVISGFHLDAVKFGYSDQDNFNFANLTFSNNEIDDLSLPNVNSQITSLTMINNLIYPGDGGFEWDQTNGNDIQNNFIHFRKTFRPTGSNLLKNNIIVIESTFPRTAYDTDGNGDTLYEREWEIENTTWENNVIFMSQDGPSGIIDRLVFKASNVTLTNNLVLNETVVSDLLATGNMANTVTNLNTEADPFNYNDGLMPGRFPFIDLVSSFADYSLKAASVGKGAGTDGMDVGIYGGENPWKNGPNHRYELGSALNVPVIELLETNDTVVKPGEGLKVRIKAKSNR